jgi:lipopolysaccharide export system protein LptA
LSSLLGTGHASFDERTAAGVHQASAADQLDVHFVPGSGLGSGLGTGLNSVAGSNSAAPLSVAKSKESGGASEIASVVEVGHVVLTQDAPPAHASQTSQKGGLPEGQSALRATAGRADYDGKSQVLHLTVSPRVQDGGLDMSAERIDFARATGDAFAHGDVRASWIGANEQKNSPAATASVTPPGSSLLNSGGNGPVHAIAAEAELHQASQEAVFRGASNSSGNGQPGIEPRLWQSVNSVSAPVIVLNRQKMTLTAEGNGAANPVRTVLVGNTPVSSPGKAGGKNGPSGDESVSKQADSKSGNATSSNGSSKTKADGPSVIRIRSGDLRYSEAERLAIFHSGSAGEVTAETTSTTGTATIVSQEAEVKLLPAGTHPAGIAVSPGNVSSTANSQSPANSSIDRLTARGHVTADWPARRGTGEQLVYLNEDGSFTLTGTSAIPPRITDQARGTVTGSAVIYHSREDSVTVEGDGGKTETETRSKK